MASEKTLLPAPTTESSPPQRRNFLHRFFLVIVGILAINYCLTTFEATLNPYLPSSPQPDDSVLSVKQKALRILTNHPLVDGHNDLLITLRALYQNHINSPNFTEPFEQGGFKMHVDLPRLDEGKNGGAFWSAFMICPTDIFDFSDEAYAPIVRATLDQIDLYNRLSEQYPRYFTLPTNAADALAGFYSPARRLISPLAIEGLHQIGNSLSTLRLFYSLGVRYATLTWNCNNVYADATALTYSNGTTVGSTPYWGGLSMRGRELIKEMNRMGMIVDLSHVSADTMRDVLIGQHNHDAPHSDVEDNGDEWEGSLAPPIFSHSSAYALCPHPRNVPDDVLDLVAKRNSVVMVNFSPDFISCTASDSPSGIPDFYPPNSTLAQVVRHITYIGDRIGYAHVGLGSDFDGIPAAPAGLDDVSKFPDLVAKLLEQGVSESDVVKVIGGNVMRVWAEVDAVSNKLKATGMRPAEDKLDHPFGI